MKETTNEATDRILAALRAYQHEHQIPPSLRELAAATGYSLAPLVYRLRQMENAGLIHVERKQARGIRVL